MRKASLICLALLGACVGPRDGFRTNRPPELSRSWLAGSWVLKGDSCDSDAGVLYRPDGRWISYGVAGSWRVKGDRIILLVETEDNGEARRIDPPIRYDERVQILGPNEFVARRTDGPERRLVRCTGRRG